MEKAEVVKADIPLVKSFVQKPQPLSDAGPDILMIIWMCFVGFLKIERSADISFVTCGVQVVKDDSENYFSCLNAQWVCFLVEIEKNNKAQLCLLSSVFMRMPKSKVLMCYYLD